MPMALQRPREYTLDEFEAFIALPENADRRFELIDGEIVEKVPTEEHGVIISIINGEIYVYLKDNPIGRVAVEARHKMPEDRRNSRIPDLAFTSAERALPITRKGAVPQMPDLAVEVKSPDDSIGLMRAKAAFYLENGTRMVWLVYPDQRLVEVYRPDVDIVLLVDNEERHDVLDGSDVLPGFSIALQSIFPS